MIDSHHIQCLKFDLNIPLASKNRDIQNKVVAVFNAQFTNMLNEVFTQYSKYEDIIINSLTLELEPIAIEQFGKNIVRQSRDQLLAYFEEYKFKDKLVSGKTIANVGLNDRNLHPLIYFLFHGVNSWIATDNSSFVKSWKAELHKEAFRSQLKRLRWNKTAVTRLVYLLNVSLYHETIQILYPSNLTEINVFHEVLIALHDQKNPLKSNSLNDYQKLIWEHTFNFLLLKKRGTFSKLKLIQQHIQYLSTTYDWSKDDLINDLIYIAGQNSTLKLEAEDFLPVFKEIQSKSNPKPSAGIIFNDENSIQNIRKLIFKTKKTHENIIFLKNWIVNPRNKDIIQQTWVESLDENVLEKVLSILSPTGSRFILEYHQVVYRYHHSYSFATPLNSLKRAVWSFTLAYLRMSFSSVFEAKEFVHYHSKKMSNRFGIDYIIFNQSLLFSVRSLKQNNVKYHELLIILKTLANEQLDFDIEKKGLINSNNSISFNRIKEILENKNSISYQESQAIKQWLINKNNRVSIQKYWIENFNQPIFNRTIEIVFPIKKSFIEESIIAVFNLFKNSQLINSSSLDLRKNLYVILIDYLQENPNNFSKKSFIEFQIKTILKQYRIPYRVFIIHYGKFLHTNKTIQIQQLEYFNILNALQNEFEKGAGLKNANSFIKMIDINRVCDYFESGKLSDYNTIQPILIKSSGFKALHGAMEHLLVHNQEKWFSFLQAREKPWQIDKTVFAKMNTTLLRNILVFETMYKKWVRLNNQLDKHKNHYLTSSDVAMIFYIEEGFIPKWISKSKQQTIRNRAFTKKTSSILLAHNWTSKGVHNWAYNISINKKKSVLKEWVNNVVEHTLFRLYDNLFLVYKSIPSNNKPTMFLNFEMSFWVIFFKILNVNNSISSSNFTELFFKEWEFQFKISFSNNAEIKRILKSSSYLPESLIIDPIKLTSLIRDPKENNIEELLPIEQKESTNVELLENKLNQMISNLSKWHLEHAGLILVHPFLSYLFKNLGYLNDDNQFKNEKLLWKAVYLLYYVSSGQNSNVNEENLAMPKILCGMRIQDPISSNVLLAKEEKKLAEELLIAVISQWEKLGNTSAESLRNTFLKRNGLLEEKDATYQLSLETSGTDILLDYIPWNINIIKLPWVKNIIYISWR